MGVPHTVIFVLVIIIACNAVLYPSLFSSIFRMWFGYPAPKEEHEKMPEYPPHMRGRMHSGARHPQQQGDSARYMSHQRQTEGSSRGMMGTILPVYALGIFVYFGYVIHKVFLKPKPATNQQDPWAYDDDQSNGGPSLERQQEENLQRQLAAELRAANYDGMGGHRRHRSSDSQFMQSAGGSPREARSGPSTPRADASDVDLLKQRLEQTERTMDKMMEMMNNMGVAFNRVTEQLNIDAGVPVKPQSRGLEVGDDMTSEGEEESWSEGSEVLEGARPEDLGGPDESIEGLGDAEDRDELSGSRIEDIQMKAGKGSEEENSMRRRKATVDDVGNEG